MNYKVVAGILIKMKNEDLELRAKLLESGEMGTGYNDEMEQLHTANKERLDEIIKRIGYPTIEKVGKEANEAAWLIVQHSIGHPKFMKNCLELLENEVNDTMESKRNLAYLSDRIAVFENKKQRYGTQFDWDENGDLSPNKFDDLTKVNQRRNAIGLNTLEEQTLIMRRQAKEENQLAPKDFKEREQLYNEWRRKKGWIA